MAQPIYGPGQGAANAATACSHSRLHCNINGWLDDIVWNDRTDQESELSI
jgi:hypothetical protein